MPKIEVKNASIAFTVRQSQKVTLKEYIVKGLFRRSLNPAMTIHALSDFTLIGDRRGPDRDHRPQRGRQDDSAQDARGHLPADTSARARSKGESVHCSTSHSASSRKRPGGKTSLIGAFLQGETPASLRGKIDEIGAFSELGDFLTLPVRNYSAGMRMRLAFAIATATDPEILLIDEVLAVGDMAFQMKARARMKELMSTSRLMVVVSHDLNTIKETCNRVLWMKHGKVVKEGDDGGGRSSIHRQRRRETPRRERPDGGNDAGAVQRSVGDPAEDGSRPHDREPAPRTFATGSRRDVLACTPASAHAASLPDSSSRPVRTTGTTRTAKAVRDSRCPNDWRSGLHEAFMPRTFTR